jgi:hypothetical protein
VRSTGFLGELSATLTLPDYGRVAHDSGATAKVPRRSTSAVSRNSMPDYVANRLGWVRKPLAPKENRMKP